MPVQMSHSRGKLYQIIISVHPLQFLSLTYIDGPSYAYEPAQFEAFFEAMQTISSLPLVEQAASFLLVGITYWQEVRDKLCAIAGRLTGRSTIGITLLLARPRRTSSLQLRMMFLRGRRRHRAKQPTKVNFVPAPCCKILKMCFNFTCAACSNPNFGPALGISCFSLLVTHTNFAG